MLINQAGTNRALNALSPELRDMLLFIENVRREDGDFSSQAPDDAPYFLGQISAKAGKFYERVRSAVDNKEEHFLRRYAIRRIVKRIMWFSEDPKVITGRLLRELYRSGYLPENRISRRTEDDISRVVSVFLALSDGVEERHRPAEFLSLRARLLDIIAGEIEDRIYPTYNEEAVARLLARITHERTDAEGASIARESLPLAMYVAAWKALYSADRELLVYKLWRTEYPGWEHQDDNSLALIAHGFPEFLAKANSLIDQPVVGRISVKMRDDAIALTVLHDLLVSYGKGLEDLARERSALVGRAEEAVSDRYRADKRRAKRKSWNAVVYILATKALLAVAVESVYVALLSVKLALLPLAVNILFHPALLFALTARMPTPSERNTDRILARLVDIVYGSAGARISLERRGFGILGDLALALYLVILFAMTYGIWLLLSMLGFHAIDIVFFIGFLALILYFSFRVRYGARRMELSGSKEGFWRSFFELLSLPIVSVGRYMVTRFEKLNLIALFMDFFVELPLKLVLEFFDAFSVVLKEKKDEIYS